MPTKSVRESSAAFIEFASMERKDLRSKTSRLSKSTRFETDRKQHALFKTYSVKEDIKRSDAIDIKSSNVMNEDSSNGKASDGNVPIEDSEISNSSQDNSRNKEISEIHTTLNEKLFKINAQYTAMMERIDVLFSNLDRLAESKVGDANDPSHGKFLEHQVNTIESKNELVMEMLEDIGEVYTKLLDQAKDHEAKAEGKETFPKESERTPDLTLADASLEEKSQREQETLSESTNVKWKPLFFMRAKFSPSEEAGNEDNVSFDVINRRRSSFMNFFKDNRLNSVYSLSLDPEDEDEESDEDGDQIKHVRFCDEETQDKAQENQVQIIQPRFWRSLLKRNPDAEKKQPGHLKQESDGSS